MAMRRFSFGVVLTVAMSSITPAFAADPEACAAHKWPLDGAIAVFAAGAAETLDAEGATWRAGQAQAFTLRLSPQNEVAFVLPPERARAGGEGFAGVVRLTGLVDGDYEVSLSQGPWVDVVQDGRYIPSKTFSGAAGCPVRKSVRFALSAGEAWLQISENRDDTVIVAVLPSGE